MALRPDELAKVGKHLEGKLRACPMCGNDKWEPLEIVGTPVLKRYAPGTYVPGSAAEILGRLYTERSTPSETIPLLLVACTNCFHVVPYAWKLIEAQGA